MGAVPKVELIGENIQRLKATASLNSQRNIPHMAT